MKEENWGYLLLKISQNKMLHTDYSTSVYSGGQHTLIYVWRVNRAIEIRRGRGGRARTKTVQHRFTLIVLTNFSTIISAMPASQKYHLQKFTYFRSHLKKNVFFFS